ncbi:MAG TPA: hypothetical protein DCS93_03660 [Microscillaceae bacterium]|nr:hypothetical protein [Microscillaceae bacterium]
MKSNLLFLGLLFSYQAYSQRLPTNRQVNKNTVVVLAKLLSYEGGSKVQIAKYQVLKKVQGKASNKIIRVGYYFYNALKKMPKTALLKIEKYTGNVDIQDYYIFPNYDPKKGIENVPIHTVTFKEWEACEKALKSCKPASITRSVKGQKSYLILPCGGTLTTATLSAQPGLPTKATQVIQKIEVSSAKCPPVFELTHLKDGKYFVYLMGCGLGGPMEIILKSNR